ncbi:GDSL-type esterase/lipase family protein [Nocardiopsis sp. NRRL B-16309]|uniref:GDSL-type esterase/lipase family protein n=1 Tax=Nocardiopsis sp. NRRL B-16309 TaxID=1519494 RepID=UPI0006ADD2B3|nr:GDSL-type esterase/lipase family protein [Nocardiopsis sp. NRRL B-16309]KOX18106.1 G-D-S-L family lipolytic protein [Nocardiopsis sp. NRRL B-16309]
MWTHLLRGTGALVMLVVLLIVVNSTVFRDVDARPRSERPSGPVPKAFSTFIDRAGISPDGAATSADLDGSGNSLSARSLAAAGWVPGGDVVLLGTPFRLPAYSRGRPDHLLADGQPVVLEDTRVRSVGFLVTGSRVGGGGDDVLGTGTVVYADGTEQDFTLSVPHWTEGPAGDAVLTLPYANSSSAIENDPSGPVRLYARSVPVDPLREVDHVVLPEVAEDSARMHVFSVGGRSAGEDWTGTWARATSGYMEVGPWEDQTLRLAVRSTAGGHRVRIRLDNTFAERPVRVGAASLALRGQGAATRGSALPLAFGGRSETVIPAGGQVFSDPVEILLPPHTDVLVSLHLPDRVTAAPVHYASVDTNFTSAPGTGDQTLVAGGEPFTGRVDQWPFLAGVEVLDGPGAVVAFGDSITDGTRSTRDAHARWPDVLSARLAEQPELPNLGVLNMGVAGNHVVTDGYPGSGVSTYANGVAMTHRAQRDVFTREGVGTLIVFAGINDLRWGTDPREVIAGLESIADTADEHGVRVFVATLGPCGGEARCTEAVERARQLVNTHLRGQADDPASVFAGVWDFDAVLRDPQDPARMRPEYDSGDHLHPGDAGLRALAESVDLHQLVGV